MPDRLTPRERFGLLVIDEPQDRVPVFPLVTSHAATVAGVTLADYHRDGAKHARAQLLAQERYGHDFISVFSEVGIVAEALGSQLEFPADDLPRLKTPLFSTVDDFARIPEIEPGRAGRFPVYYEAIEYAYAAVGDRIPILAFVPAPFTSALHLLPGDEFLVSLSESPAGCHQVLERITRATLGFLERIIRCCGLPVLVDPLASGSVIGPRTFREFALPYERRLIDFLHRYDLDIILHICGDTMPLLELLPETGADLVSLDRIDLPAARAAIGDKLRLIGSYHTSDLLLKEPSQIEYEVRQMVGQGMGTPRGFVAATGCEVPVRAPTANVAAFIRAARVEGRFEQ
jgi:uroporphyrinogen decarboxylase